MWFVSSSIHLASSLYDSLAVAVAVARRTGALISEGIIRQQHATLKMVLSRKGAKRRLVVSSSVCSRDERRHLQLHGEQEGVWGVGVGVGGARVGVVA